MKIIQIHLQLRSFAQIVANTLRTGHKFLVCKRMFMKLPNTKCIRVVNHFFEFVVNFCWLLNFKVFLQCLETIVFWNKADGIWSIIFFTLHIKHITLILRIIIGAKTPARILSGKSIYKYSRFTGSTPSFLSIIVGKRRVASFLEYSFDREQMNSGVFQIRSKTMKVFTLGRACTWRGNICNALIMMAT